MHILHLDYADVVSMDTAYRQQGAVPQDMWASISMWI